MNSSEPLVIEKLYDAGCTEVFDAWADPDIMRQWFFVDPAWSAEVEADVRPGGRYRLAMITEAGERHTMTGEYLEVDRPRRLVFTWSSHVVSDTKVTIELETLDGRTRLRLTHEGIADAVARERHEAGWGGCLANLARRLGTTRVSS